MIQQNKSGSYIDARYMLKSNNDNIQPDKISKHKQLDTPITKDGELRISISI